MKKVLIVICLAFLINVTSYSTDRNLLTNDNSWLTCVDLSNNASYLATASISNIIKVWDYKSLTLLHRFDYHKSWITNLYFISDEEYLVSIDKDGLIIIWDLKEGKPLHFLKGLSCCVSSNGKYIAINNKEQKIELWDTLNKEKLFQYVTEKNCITPMIIGNDKDYDITIDCDKKVRFFDYTLNSTKWEKIIPCNGILNIQESNNNKWIIISILDNNEFYKGYVLQLFLKTNGEMLSKILIPEHDVIQSIIIDKEDKNLYFGSQNRGNVYKFNLPLNKLLFSINIGGTQINKLLLSQDQKILYCITLDSIIEINTDNGSVLNNMFIKSISKE